jgi:hypothetical protein
MMVENPLFFRVRQAFSCWNSCWAFLISPIPVINPGMGEIPSGKKPPVQLKWHPVEVAKVGLLKGKVYLFPPPLVPLQRGTSFSTLLLRSSRRGQRRHSLYLYWERWQKAAKLSPSGEPVPYPKVREGNRGRTRQMEALYYTDLQLISPTFGTGQVVQKSNCRYGIYFAALK